MNRLRLMLDKSFYPEYLRRQGVQIGTNTSVLYPAYIDGRLPYLVEIGDNVIISLNVTILTHDATTAYAGDLIKVGKVVIRDRCFIGANSTILCNVTVGPNSIVGAGSMVIRDVPPDTVCAGNPARVIGTVEEFKKTHAVLGKERPLFLAGNYMHPYIPEETRKELRRALAGDFGYFCSKFPRE